MGKTRLPKKPIPNKQVDEFQSLVKRINDNEVSNMDVDKRITLVFWVLFGLLILNFIGDIL